MDAEGCVSRASSTRLPAALEREWLVTNGLGGFASGTVALANARRYHALLVAALRPPLERTVLVAKVDITALCGSELSALACNEFADGTIAPSGFELLEDFRLDHGLPVRTYALKDVRLEQRVWMEYGYNTSCLSLTLTHAMEPSVGETLRAWHVLARAANSISSSHTGGAA